ncbi:MAG: cysteine dioxygenase family protein [Saprospiraceae bacterium]|nr:cysteine dioxygenase family protein [Bacteroidia bacterium]NNE14762.1 cysteine dioxygenase family protein [Saprospiraceae bacterium]
MSIQDTDIQHLVIEARKIVNEELTDLSGLNKLLSRQTLLPFADWMDKSYTRVCLHEDEEFELVLICWQPMAKTVIHNHNKQNCWVFCFDSNFEETIFCEKGQDKLKIKQIEKGGITFMTEGNNCHTLQNKSTSQALSLHLYNRPIKTCGIVKPSSESVHLEKAVLEYDAVLP